MTKAKAYYQAYLVLECLSDEEYSLIPQSLLDEITSRMEKDDNIKVDSTIPLEKQKIDEKTYDILDKVIRAIERNYGKDAIDNPGKYADADYKKPHKKEEPVVKKELVSTVQPKKVVPKSTMTSVDVDKSRERIKRLETENIKLRGIIKALEEENKKVDQARELFIDYKDMVARKDQKINELNKEVADLQKANLELKQDIDRLPKLIRRIFIRDNIKKLT